MPTQAPETNCDILSDVENIRRCFRRHLSLGLSVCLGYTRTCKWCI